MSDEKIIQAIKDGDEQVISMVMRKYSKLLWKVTSVILVNASSVQEVEECVADVFIYLWRYPEKYESEKGKLSSWLCMVARSKAIDRYRNIIRKQEVSIEEQYNELSKKGSMLEESYKYDIVFQTYGKIIEPLAKLMEKEEKELLSSCIETLEDVEKEILVRRYYYEQKPKEIAIALDMQKKTSRKLSISNKTKIEKENEIVERKKAWKNLMKNIENIFSKYLNKKQE